MCQTSSLSVKSSSFPGVLDGCELTIGLGDQRADSEHTQPMRGHISIRARAHALTCMMLGMPYTSPPDYSDAPGPVMVVDTNYFFTDLRLRGADWTQLLGFVRSEVLTICVPEIVVRETVRHNRRNVSANIGGRIKELQKALKALEYQGLEIPSVNVGALTDQELALADGYESSIRAKFDDSGVRVHPLPATRTEDLVDRYMDERKPFKTQGKGVGLADVIVWASFKEIERTLPQNVEISLVTDNSKDFFDRDDNLHSDLGSELAHPERVRTFRTPGSFLTHYGSSLEFEEVWATIQPPRPTDSTNEFVSEAASEWAQSYLIDEEIHYESEERYSHGIEVENLDLPAGLLNPVFEWLDLDDGQWAPYDAVEGGELGRVTLTGTATVAGYMTKADYYGSGDKDLSVRDADLHDSMLEIAVTRAIEVELNAEVATDGSERVEILNIERVAVLDNAA